MHCYVLVLEYEPIISYYILQSVTSVYSDWKEDKQTQMIVFENDEITLDLPCDPTKLIVVNNWRFLPLTYPKVCQLNSD